MIRFNENRSRFKHIPGAISASGGELVIHAHEVRNGADAYAIPSMIVEIPPASSPTAHDVVLTSSGSVVHRSWPENELPPIVEDELFVLAHLVLRSPEDTLESVDVYVARLLPEETRSVQVSAKLERRARMREEPPVVEDRGQDQAIAAVASKPPASWTSEETRAALASLLRERGVPVPQDTPSEPKRRP